jgi:hypothetical protein
MRLHEAAEPGKAIIGADQFGVGLSQGRGGRLDDFIPTELQLITQVIQEE